MENNVKSSTNKKTKVIVVGRNYCNILTMARAFGQAGYEVEVLRLYKEKPKWFNLLQNLKPETDSKYVLRFHECIINQSPQVAIEKLIGIADKRNVNLLFPVDDYSVCIIDHHLDQLSTKYIVPNIKHKAGEITRLMDKFEQKRLASAFGLPVLDSVLIKSKNGVFQIPEGIEFPCFVKPNVSMNSTKAKMVKCDDVEQLNRVLTSYAQSDDFEMLIEPFADIKAEYSLLGLRTSDGVIAPALFKALAGGHKERKGVAITGEIVDCLPFQPLIDSCKNYVTSLDFSGIFDIDLIETKDGKVFFIELNFRAGASTYAFISAGVNLAGIFADNLLKGIPIDKECCVTKNGLHFVSEKVLLEHYIRREADIN